MEDKVKNVADHMKTADAAEATVRAKASEANGGMPLTGAIKESTEKAVGEARAPAEANAQERAHSIASEAKTFTSALNSTASKSKIEQGQSMLRAASAAHEILGNKDAAQSFAKEADQLEQTVAATAPPKGPSDGGDGGNV